MSDRLTEAARRMCDCERGHNGMGEAGRECDCEEPPVWPMHGPGFNAWCDDLVRLAEMIRDASNEFWWCADPQLKYLEIRVDTRDGGFVLFDRDRSQISPDRVVKAIEKWRAEHGGHKLRKPRALQELDT